MFSLIFNVAVAIISLINFYIFLYIGLAGSRALILFLEDTFPVIMSNNLVFYSAVVILSAVIVTISIVVAKIINDKKIIVRALDNLLDNLVCNYNRTEGEKATLKSRRPSFMSKKDLDQW